MITQNSLIQRIRLFAGDALKTRYSDYEIIEAIHTAVDMLCVMLKKYASPELMKRTVVELTDGEGALPIGFMNIVNVEDAAGNQMFTNYEQEDIPVGYYRIEGDMILSSEDEIHLAYMKNPIGADGSIDLPDSFLIYLAGASLNLLRCELEAASGKLEESVHKNNMDKRGVIPDPRMWIG